MSANGYLLIKGYSKGWMGEKTEMSRVTLCSLRSALTATACLLMVPSFTVKSSTATLLASL